MPENEHKDIQELREILSNFKGIKANIALSFSGIMQSMAKDTKRFIDGDRDGVISAKEMLDGLANPKLDGMLADNLRNTIAGVCAMGQENELANILRSDNPADAMNRAITAYNQEHSANTIPLLSDEEKGNFNKLSHIGREIFPPTPQSFPTGSDLCAANQKGRKHTR